MRGAWVLLRFQLRRERWILPVWIVGIIGLLAAAGTAVAREFGGDQERFALAAVAAGNPAFLFLRGLPDGSETGALVFFQTFAFLAVLTGLMNVFAVVRHTRADEERGRSEQLAATPIPRTSELATALVVALLANLALALGSLIVCLALGFGVSASVVTGLAVGSVGVAFAGLAAVCAQIAPSPRGANGLGAGLVGAAYLVRGIGDALGTATDATHVDPSWISRLSPIGWAQASAPFSDADGYPLLVPIVLGIGAATLALAIRSHRDLGTSMVPETAGRPAWRRPSALRLAFRQQRASILGWAVGGAILGSFAGLLAPLVAEAVKSNDALADLIGRLVPGLQVDTGTLFTIALLGIAGLLATAAGVQTLIRMRGDEAEDRAEALLSARLSRARWLGWQVLTAAVAVLGVALVAGLSAGISLTLAHRDVGQLWTALGMVFVELPAGSVFVGLTALAFAVVPRATIAMGWGLLVIGLALGQLGDLLGIPEWLQVISPFSHVPAVPLEPVDPIPMVILLAITAGLLVGAVFALRRRDIPQ